MKKGTLLLLLLLCVKFTYAQKIAKKEVDKFTKSEIITTSKETLYTVNYMGTGYCYQFEFFIRCENGKYTMPANVLMRDIVKYTEDDGVMLLLSNDETVTLPPLFAGVGADPFAKGYYFSTAYDLSDEAVEKLKNNKVTNIRVSYLGGHYDRELKGKKQELISNMLRLFDK